MFRYSERLPEMVRVKVGYAPDLRPVVELSRAEADFFGLMGAAEEAVRMGRLREEALTRFGRDYPSAVAEPSITLVPREKILSLARLLKSRGVDLFRDSVVLSVDGSVLTLSVEYECG
ncbi:MAG: hypothetical protein RMJ28_00920 [Nitrososphaerota archaeon]|nr:hypothetical protein [Candidatus Calditenuaceae archaeon]MDW8072794.1 hypothetical protein [Nitrososphaerota archaeon]